VSRSDRDRLLDVLEAGAAIAEHLQRGPLSDGLVFDAVRVRLIDTSHAIVAQTVGSDLAELLAATRSLLAALDTQG